VLASIPLLWSWKQLNGAAWLILVSIGVMAAAYQACLTRAYRTTRASVIGGLIQTALIFSVAYDWIFYRLTPSLLVIAGMLLIAGASAWVIALAQPQHPQED